MPSITVVLPKTAVRDRARKYRILVDGAAVARLGHGESTRIDLAPGRHEIRAKIDWATTPPLALDLGADDAIELSVTTGAGTAFDAFVRPSRYLRLEPVDAIPPPPPA